MQKLTVGDFSAGAWLHEDTDALQPRQSVSRLEDVHVADSGVVRARGASTLKLAGDLHSVGTLSGRFVWAGTLLPGRRALMGVGPAGGGLGRLRRVLPDFSAYVDAVGGGEIVGEYDAVSIVGNTLAVGARSTSGGGPTNAILWGGSHKVAYTGVTSLSRTAGSKVVTRAAGGFLANVDVGMLIAGWRTAGGLSTTGAGWAVVVSVDSDTQITVDRPSPFTEVVNGSLYPFVSVEWDAGTVVFGIPGSVGGRLLMLKDNVLSFSEGPNPADGSPQTDVRPATNRHEFPNDFQGLALASLRDSVFCFTEAGVIVVRNMAYDIVDGSGNPQHQLEELTSKSIAISNKAIVRWQGALIVPCRDGLYAMDGYGQPILLSRGIPWAEMVAGGLELGWATVYKGRYVVPYKYGGGTSSFVIRMDARETEQGAMYPVSTFNLPSDIFATATTTDPDELLGVGSRTAGLIECGRIFDVGTSGVDQDGSSVGGNVVLETAPIILGDKSTVRRVRVRYTFEYGTFTLSPQLEVRVETPSAGVTESVAIVTAAQAWVAVDLDPAIEGSSVTVRLRLSSAHPSKFIAHAVEIQYRQFGGL